MIAMSTSLRSRRGVIRNRCRLALALGACVGSAALGQESGNEFEFCLVCHGSQAHGNAAIGAPNLSILEPEYLRRQLEAYSAGSRGTHAQDAYGAEMQPMAAQLDDEQLARAAAWVSGFADVAARTTVEGNAMRGADLYRQCETCHGSAGEGNEDLEAPRLSGQSDWYLLRQIDAYRRGWRGASPDDVPGMQMRALVARLDDDEAVNDLVAYINTLTPENR